MYNKYKNIKVERLYNGEVVKFDSKKEGKRFDELILLEKKGMITELTLQPKFHLLDTLSIPEHKTMKKRSYIADFSYILNGVLIVEDTKGFLTDIYKLKKHLFLSIYKDKLVFREL